MKSDLNLDKIFQQSPKEPFSLSLTVHLKDSEIETLYDYLKNFYIRGLSILINKHTYSNAVLLRKIDKKHLDLMQKYMLSLGIEVFYREYSISELDYLYRDFLYEIKKIPNLEIRVTLDWKKQLIHQIAMKLHKLTNDECIKFWTIAQKYNIVNFFFKFYKPNKLKDFGFIVKDNDRTHIVYFDFASRGKYQKKYKIINNKI